MDGITISVMTLLLTTVVSLFVAVIISILVKSLLWFSKVNASRKSPSTLANAQKDDLEIAAAIAVAALSRRVLQ